MGLDLRAGNHSVRVGSYSFVHDLRQELLVAAGAAARDTQCPADVRDTIDSWLIETGDGYSIDYAAMSAWGISDPVIPDHPILHYTNTFINMSDCDGAWTPEEARRCLAFLTIVSPFVRHDGLSGLPLKRVTEELIDFFQEACADGLPVELR